MLLTDMHIWFRQYAQQMGMQNVRAILPEQIDVFINTSIDDTINDIVRSNVAVTNDRVITDNSKLGNINALRTLYISKDFELTKDLYSICYGVITKSALNDVFDGNNNDVICSLILNDEVVVDSLATVDASDIESALVNTTFDGTRQGAVSSTYYYYPDTSKFRVVISTENGSSFDTTDEWKIRFYNTGTDIEYVSDAFIVDTTSGINTVSSLTLDVDEVNSGKLSTTIPDCLFYCDLAIDYKQASAGYYKDNLITVLPQLSGAATQWYPVRIIEDQYLADVLQDFILKPTLRSPVVVIHSNGILDLYLGTPLGGISSKIRGTNADNSIIFKNNLCPFKLRMSYIKKPQHVSYNEDNLAANIECDMPEYMHVDILKHAVDLYHVAIQGSLMSAQNQARRQNQEIARNNERNEGYAPQS